MGSSVSLSLPGFLYRDDCSLQLACLIYYFPVPSKNSSKKSLSRLPCVTIMDA
jgi:hypothetical protein